MTLFWDQALIGSMRGRIRCDSGSSTFLVSGSVLGNTLITFE